MHIKLCPWCRVANLFGGCYNAAFLDPFLAVRGLFLFRASEISIWKLSSDFQIHKQMTQYSSQSECEFGFDVQ